MNVTFCFRFSLRTLVGHGELVCIWSGLVVRVVCERKTVLRELAKVDVPFAQRANINR